MIEHPDPAAARTVRKTELSQFFSRAKRAVGLKGEVSVLLADDKRLKQLNRAFRGKNKPTDVLSFPAPEEIPNYAGDLAISLDTAKKQAAEFRHSRDQEIRVLLLHGLLHLAGYDHETDQGEMAAREMVLRKRLGLKTNLIHRAHTQAVRA